MANHLRWPTRWLFHRVKRSFYLLALISVILALVFGSVLLMRSEAAQRLASMAGRSGLGSAGSRQKQGIVQYYPDNHYKHLFRKDVEQPSDPQKPVDPVAAEGEVNAYEELLKQSVVGAAAGKENGSDDNSVTPNYDVHVFYYAWYSSQATDGRYDHWNHRYLENWDKNDPKVYPSGNHDPSKDDVGSNFFPLLGCYSSRDEAVLTEHMRQIRSSGAGVLVVSWYPPGLSDDNGPVVDARMPGLLDAAEAHGLKVALHVEPYRDLNVTNMRENLAYVLRTYGNHPAFYRRKVGRRRMPVFYLYDSYRISPKEWQRLFSRRGDLTVRDTELDAIFLGLLVEIQHKADIQKSKFDGFYTYFASNGFSHGSSWKNWRALKDFAAKSSLLFVPSVGPGYIDVRIRPWNSKANRERRAGSYYALAWRTALMWKPDMVSITSFNEWGEGTQIEPAVPKVTSSFTYMDYLPNKPDFYLQETRKWVEKFAEKDQEKRVDNKDINIL